MDHIQLKTRPKAENGEKRERQGGNLSEERHFPPFPNPAGLCPFPKAPALGSGIGCGFPSPQHGENTAFFPVFRWRPNGCGSLLAIPLECGESLSHFPRSYLIESLRIPVSFGWGGTSENGRLPRWRGVRFFAGGGAVRPLPFRGAGIGSSQTAPPFSRGPGGLSAACFFRTAGR